MLACHRTHPPVPWQLTIAMATARRALQGLISHEYVSLFTQFPPYYLDPPMYMASQPKWGWEVDLQTKFSFSILWPLNKACTVSVSATFSLLAVWIWTEKEPSQLRQGASVGLGPKGGVYMTNSVTMLYLSLCLEFHAQWNIYAQS